MVVMVSLLTNRRPPFVGTEVHGTADGDGFYAYLDVVKSVGGRWCPSTKQHEIILSCLGELLAGFTSRGLSVCLSNDLQEHCVSEKAKAVQSWKRAKSRIATTDRRLSRQGYALTDVQKSGILWLSTKKRALLRDGVGAGKTAQLLVALPTDACALVLTTASAVGSWVSECNLWRPDLQPKRITKSKSKLVAEKGKVFVASWSSIPHSLVCDVDAFILIADEAHKLKNAKTGRHIAFRSLRDEVLSKDGCVWLATATPLINKPPDLWNVLRSAGLELLSFGSWDRFVDLMGGKKGEWGYEWGHAQARSKECVAKVSIQRMPDFGRPIRRSVIVDKLPADTLQHLNSAVKLLDDLGVKACGQDDVLTRLPAPAFAQVMQTKRFLTLAKMVVAQDIVESYEEQCEPLVVFSSFVEPIVTLGSRAGWRCITGSTPSLERTRIIESFQSGQLKGLALVTEAGGEAITLTRAAHCLFIDLPWTAAMVAQTEGRLIRMGQKRKVLVTRLLAAHPFEQRVLEILEHKQLLMSQLNATI